VHRPYWHSFEMAWGNVKTVRLANFCPGLHQ
jgi:hypothetical protein